jgi:hypothetical protein
MFPAVAYALEIKTFTDSMPHIIVPHVTTPQVNTHIITPQVKLHVITPEGSTGSKITNTNSDNITIKDSHTKLQNQTNGLQQQSTVGGATGGAGSKVLNLGAPAAGAGAGKAEFSEFSVRKINDIAPPSFFASATSGASFSLNKIDPTGKASVVSLINPGADNPKISDQVSPAVLLGLDHSNSIATAPTPGGGSNNEGSEYAKISDQVSPAVLLGLDHSNSIVTAPTPGGGSTNEGSEYGGPTVSNPKISRQVSSAVLLGLEHGDLDRPFIIGSVYSGGDATGAAPIKVGGNIFPGDRFKGK